MEFPKFEIFIGKDDQHYFRLFAENGEILFKQNNRTFFPGIKGKWRMIRTNEWKLIYIPIQKRIFMSCII